MLFTVGTKEDLKITDVSGRRNCSTHSPVWNSYSTAAKWRDVYQKDKEIFAVFAEWDGDTRVVDGAPYRQTVESFTAVNVETELPSWMYSLCDVLSNSLISDGICKFCGEGIRKRLKIIILDSLLQFDFLVG